MHHPDQAAAETSEAPPALPPRPLGPRDPHSPASPDSDSFVPLRTSIAATSRDRIVLYVAKLPGSESLLLTPTKPHNDGITDFDVNYGAYLLQQDDPELYRAEVEAFAKAQAEAPRQTVEIPRRVPAPASALSDVTNAKRSDREETALDQLLREEEERASENKRFAELKSFGGQLINHKPKPLPDHNELRNLHQRPLAARGLVPQDAKPLKLHRIGVLPGQSREVGEVAHLLDTWRKPARFRRPTLASNHADDADIPEKEDSAGYIDMLEEAYEPFGTDVNYITPSWIKVFTRRLFKWKGHIDEDFVMLSPWQGHLIFSSSKVRNNIVCYHIPPNSGPSERILVSELRINVYPQAARPRRAARHSSSDSNSNDNPSLVHRPGSFPTAGFGRTRGVSESSPLSTVEAAQDTSARRNGRIARLLQKVEQVAIRSTSPPLPSHNSATPTTKPRSVSNATLLTSDLSRSKRDAIKSFASNAASSIKSKISTPADREHDRERPQSRFSYASTTTTTTTTTTTDVFPPRQQAPPSNRSSLATSPQEHSPLHPPRPLNASSAALSHSSSDNASPRPQSRLSMASSLGKDAFGGGGGGTGDDRMDLSLGQERLGGGLRGRDAKLAKIVVYGEGQQMLDLVVAANLVLFWRAYSMARGEA